MKSCLLLIYLVLFCIQLSSQPVINEVIYANKSGLSDDEGNSPDWFELYNPGNDAVNLENYRVTDDTSKIDSWIFPKYNLKAKAYLIVYASGKNKNHGHVLHTDFKLRNMKESLFLIFPNGEIADKTDPTCVPTDCSFARVPDGSDNFNIIKPTPGKSNNNAEVIPVNYITDSLIINLESGLYEMPVTVTLSNLHAGNKIVYTLDGSDPDEESVFYENPIHLTDLTPSKNRFADYHESIVDPGELIFKGNILRAVVFSDGCPASNEISNTYFIGDNIKNKYPVNIISLITDKDNLFDNEKGIYVAGKHRNFDQHGGKWERLAHIEIFDTAGFQIIDQDAGIRIHGRGSRKSPQKSIRLYTGEQYGTEYFNYPFFKQKPGITRYKTLMLRATGGCFGVLFKDELCHYLVKDMNIDYQAGETSLLFINGEYWGIYSLMERQDKFYIENNYGDIDTKLNIIGYDMENILVEEGSIDPYNEITDFLQNTDPSSVDFFNEISKKIDIDGVIDYFVAQLYFANNDFPQNNLELWKTDNDASRWRYFFFDSDFSMMKLNYDHLSEYNNTQDEFQRFPSYSTLILRSLLKNEEFRNKFLFTYQHHLETTFSPGRVINAINRYEKKYAPLVPEHIYRWNDPVDYVKWEDEVEWLRVFAMQRPVIIAGQLRNNFGDPFTVYPNPCRDQFNIDFSGEIEAANVFIYSVRGELLDQRLCSSSENLIQISPVLSTGLYMLIIEMEDMSYFKKLIIQ